MASKSLGRRSLCYLIPILGLLLALAAPAQQSQKEPAPREVRYNVVDLGMLQGCDHIVATAVNDSGWVIGYAWKRSLGAAHGHIWPRPFLWRNGIITELSDLGGEHGQALCVNEQGDIGGCSYTKDYRVVPVIWRRSEGYAPTALSKLNGRVLALADDGTAVGEVSHKEDELAARWVQGNTDVLSHKDDVAGVGNGINRGGTVVGFTIPKGSWRGFAAWSEGDQHAAMWKDGRQIMLPELFDAKRKEPGYGGARHSECLAINDRGVAVGWSDGPSGRRACVWKDGKVEALPSNAEQQSRARSINREGDIVGEVGEKACIWKAGKLEYLKDMIPASSKWRLHSASHITDRGLIVGHGRNKDYPDVVDRAFLLMPVIK